MIFKDLFGVNQSKGWIYGSYVYYTKYIPIAFVDTP